MSYDVSVSYAEQDPAWDAFLAQTPGSHHVQSSLWASLKSTLGWQATRVIVTRQRRIVGGAQLLMRPLGFFGRLGYVSKGPVVTSDDPLLLDVVFTQLQRLAHEHRLMCLVLQPPNCGEAIARQLPAWGFHPGQIDLAPIASGLIELAQEPDDLLAQMHKGTRKNIRRSQRKGILTREGTDADLPAFYHLLHQTSQRRGFGEYSLEYFTAMWRLFDPHHSIKLFLAEAEGEASCECGSIARSGADNRLAGLGLLVALGGLMAARRRRRR